MSSQKEAQTTNIIHEEKNEISIENFLKAPILDNDCEESKIENIDDLLLEENEEENDFTKDTLSFVEKAFEESKVEVMKEKVEKDPLSLNYQLTSDHKDESKGRTFSFEFGDANLWVNPDEIRENLKSIAVSNNQNFVKMAKHLFLVRAGNLHTKWGFNSIREYSEKELNMSKSGAYNYLSVYGILIIRLGMTEESLVELGKTKSILMQKLFKKGILNYSNTEEWRKRALECNSEELLEILGSKNENLLESISEKKFTFKMKIKDDIDIVERAIDCAKRTTHTESDQNALVAMATEYLSENASDDQDSLEMILRKIEDRFRVKIFASSFSPEGNPSEIVYPNMNEEEEKEMISRLKK